jgi:hypothetical protein
MASWTRFDPTSVDLTDFDLARLDVTALPRRTLSLARDAAYVTVGLSLLNVQRAQVRRRELARALRR